MGFLSWSNLFHQQVMAEQNTLVLDDTHVALIGDRVQRYAKKIRLNMTILRTTCEEKVTIAQIDE